VHYRDARTAGVPARVHAAVPAAELYAVTGIQQLPFNTIYQLAATPMLPHAARLLLIPDLLAYWLTGVPGAEITNASTTSLLDVRGQAWATEVIQKAGLPPRIFPPLRRPGELIGQVTEPSGLGSPLPVIAVASHDTASAVAAVPAAGPDFAYISSGTWSLAGMELDGPVLTAASRAANFTNESGVDGTIRYLRNLTGLWLLVIAGPAEATALGNVLVQARALGAAPGDLTGMRALIRSTQPLRSFAPTSDGARAWAEAASRI